MFQDNKAFLKVDFFEGRESFQIILIHLESNEVKKFHFLAEIWPFKIFESYWRNCDLRTTLLAISPNFLVKTSNASYEPYIF